MGAIAENTRPEPVRKISRRPKTILKKPRISRRNLPTKGEMEPEQHLKFAGPIKILIIEPKSQYCQSLWLAVAVGLTHICVGAINFTILHYSFAKRDIHAALCGLAFHFFSAEAILALHYANGWSTHMRIRHRKYAHMYMQLCGFICALAGSALIIFDKGLTVTFHGLSGLIAVLLASIVVFIGLGVYITRRKWYILVHVTFGMLSFIVASMSLCSGLFLDSFMEFGRDFVYVLLGIIIYTVVFIIVSTFLKYVSKF